jgi:type I restriction enzyme S subunit
LFLGSHFSRSQLLAVTKQVTISGIDGQQLKDMVVLIPPADEQAGILADVERLCCPIGEAILAAEKGALHLREYRTRLIADVVTGKLDVREAAARLPDEAYEPQALDEIDVEASDELELDELETVEP